jgi:hypothetical protein
VRKVDEYYSPLPDVERRLEIPRILTLAYSRGPDGLVTGHTYQARLYAPVAAVLFLLAGLGLDTVFRSKTRKAHGFEVAVGRKRDLQ